MSIRELSFDELSVITGGGDAGSPDPSKCFFQPQTQTDYELAAAMVEGARDKGGKALLKGKGNLPYYKKLLKEHLCVAPVPTAKP